MNNSLSIQILFVSLILVQTTFGEGSFKNDEYDLELRIHCPVTRIRVGDEIPIVFTITNKGTRDHEFDKRNYDRSGRMLEYQLQAQDEDGKIVADPRENVEPGIMGGLSNGMGRISTGRHFSRTIALNRWALINTPGRYTVTGTYNYDIKYVRAKTVPGIIQMKTIEVKSKPIEIEIESRSRRQMGKYIKTLQKELKEYQSSNKRDNLEKRKEYIAKLAYTCDERIIPSLIELIYLNQHNNDVFWAVEGLRCYIPKTTEIKNRLINIIKKRGFVNGMTVLLKAYNCEESILTEIIGKSLESDNPDSIAEAALAAQEYPSDELIHGLIAVAKGQGPEGFNGKISGNTRDRAIYAIAWNRTDEGVEALRELLKDTKKSISKTTREAIEQAYKRHPKYPKVSDEEYTAALISLVTDNNNQWQRYAIIPLCKSRTIEGVKAIKSLLENPELDITIAETDAGVKAIRALLRSKDEKLKQFTASICEAIYREQPGRPLRDDDFPEEFREDFEEVKKKILERIQDL